MFKIIIDNATTDQFNALCKIFPNLSAEPVGNPTQPTYKYNELQTEPDSNTKAIFAVATESSNGNPHHENTVKFFHSNTEAFNFYENHALPIGDRLKVKVYFPNVDQLPLNQISETRLTLQEWYHRCNKNQTIAWRANNGRPLNYYDVIVVVNQDNHIEDIRPPFKTEKHEDDLIDYTQCFERHLIPDDIIHGEKDIQGTKEDIITYALSLIGIEPDGEGFKVSKVVLLNSMMHKNFPE
jgi:hypothetical protein